MAPSVLIGYWNIRGLGEPIRTILEYAGIEYEQKLYDFDMTDPTNPASIIESWIKDKTGGPQIIGSDTEAGLQFPNLPYMIETKPDGSKLKLTQSVAIIRHIARKVGLDAKTPEEMTKMDLYEQQAIDFRMNIIGYGYEFPMIKFKYPDYPASIKGQLAPWSQALGSNDWLMGSRLTYVDFLLYEAIEFHRFCKPDSLDDYDNLKNFRERFRSLPKVAEYFAAERYIEWPLFSPFAKTFGYERPAALA